MAETKTYVFPENGGSGSSIDPALLVALSQNGGFGGGANWMWPMFMYMMFPWLFGGMGAGFGGFGGFGGLSGGNVLGTGFLSNQLNNNSNVDTLLQALNGRADCITQLANMLNTSVGNVQNGINALQTAVQSVGNAVGLSGAQVINAIQNGNASLSQQICQCCCDNQLATERQTNTLQSQAAQNFAATQLQLAQNEAADQLTVCQQTNALQTQANANTQSIKDQIAAQSTMITKEFCDLKERELQDKITALTANNALLRSQIDNAQQTANILGQVNAQLAPIQATVSQIAAKQPNTISVQYPNVQAVNTTPCSGSWNGGWGPWGNGWGWNGFNGSFWG